LRDLLQQLRQVRLNIVDVVARHNTSLANLRRLSLNIQKRKQFLESFRVCVDLNHKMAVLNHNQAADDDNDDNHLLSSGG